MKIWMTNRLCTSVPVNKNIKGKSYIFWSQTQQFKTVPMQHQTYALFPEQFNIHISKHGLNALIIKHYSSIIRTKTNDIICKLCTVTWKIRIILQLVNILVRKQVHLDHLMMASSPLCVPASNKHTLGEIIF